MDRKLFAITLVTADLAAVENFYAKVFDATPVHSDEVSRVFSFGGTLINVLERSDAETLFAPAQAAGPGYAHPSMITIHVPNVDAEAARLEGLGVELNTRPEDKPWGIRTITFVDPAGQLWEFSHPLA
jgi:uncharacterized glyoxalase superfamily protein PhnB